MSNTSPIVTIKIDRKPTVILKPQSQGVTFTAETRLMLQFLPSGTCLSVSIHQPTLLGRLDKTQPAPAYPLIDLIPFNALQHGVSRRHCLLRPHKEQLTILDLGSTNGTYLNGNSLVAFATYTLADGDKLILGTLHLMLSFTPLQR